MLFSISRALLNLNYPEKWHVRRYFGNQEMSYKHYLACTLQVRYLSVFDRKRGKKRRKHQQVSRKWRQGFVGMAKFTMRRTHVSQLEAVLEYRGRKTPFPQRGNTNNSLQLKISRLQGL